MAGAGRCGRAIDEAARLGLCGVHLLEAYEWISREVGITDLLPSPCVACGSRLGIRYPSGWLCAICEWRVGNAPSETVPPRVDIVYYLRFGDRIKIGTSANPRSRLAQLRYEQLLAFERGGRALEQSRHRQFAAERFGGSEWFHAHPALARHINDLAAGVADPWDQYKRWVSEAIAVRD
jgi:hypothetical protein